MLDAGRAKLPLSRVDLRETVQSMIWKRNTKTPGTPSNMKEKRKTIVGL
jgi:hypothetical protein